MIPSRLQLSILFILLTLFRVTSVQAHASLASSDPPANASLSVPPDEITLRFTEPLESSFSRFVLRDSDGNLVETAQSQIDSGDQTVLLMQPGTLPDGLYTVVWRVLSTDGHSTEGSFAFGVGVTVTSDVSKPVIDESIPPESAIVRWMNLLSLALPVGSIAFWLFAWRQAVPNGQPHIEKRMRQWMAFGWLLLGITSLLSLMLQASIGADVPFWSVVTHPSLGETLTSSRYGQIWLARIVYWLGLGGVLWLARNERWLYWIALVIGGQILLTTSLYSHAAAVQTDTTAAIAGDWLHLLATSVWIGGLVQFAIVIGLVRRYFSVSTPILSTLVGYFSNFARVCVVGLAISGIYSAWLQVGSVDALFVTTYGQLLLIKIGLVIPMLAVSAINLIFTSRSLQRGEELWAGRLRGLIGAEVALGVGIMAAVGMLTAIPPARTVLAVQNAAVPDAVLEPFLEMQTGETVMAHLEISPGYVGANTFTVNLYDLDGNPLSDAQLIRLRIDNTEQNLGESELRPELNPDGAYVVDGSNLSMPGAWRIRMTVQRPGEFDTLMDFYPTVSYAPPPAAPIVETSLPMTDRVALALLTALALLASGGFFAAKTHPNWKTGAGVMTVLLLAVGGLFLFTAGSNIMARPDRTNVIAAHDAWMLPMGTGFTGGVYLAIENGTGSPQRLIGASTRASESVEFHRTSIDEHGIASMDPLGDIELAPDSNFSFSPSNNHMMLINLQRDFDVGDTFLITLMFASGSSITTEVQVVDQPPEN